MTATTSPSSRQPVQSRAVHITLWVLQAITAAAFLMAAMTKLTGAPQAVAVFEAIGFGAWFRYLMGVVEIVGAAALLIPRLSGLAGLAFVGLTVGAIITHLIVGGSLAMVLPLLVLAAVIAWGRRHTTTALIGQFVAK